MKKLLLSAIGLVSVFLFLFIFFAQTEGDTKAAIIPKVTSLPGWDLEYFGSLQDVYVAADDSFYTADSTYNEVKHFDATGVRIATWGSTGTGNGQFDNAYAVAVFGTNVYVVDRSNHRIQRFNTSGTYLSQWGTSGTGNSQFNLPEDIAVDSVGNVYVMDRWNYRIQKFNSTGTYITQWGINGAADSQDFFSMQVIAIDASDNIYVSDGGYIKKYSSTGVYATRWVVVNSAWGMDIDSNGDVLVASWLNGVYKYSNVGVSLESWTDTSVAYDLSLDSSDNVYNNGRDGSQVIKFNSSGVYQTRWSSWGSDDGQMRTPYDIDTASNGDVYIADLSNYRVQVFDSAGNYLRKWGSRGAGDGQFDNAPYDLVLDDAGLVYISDGGSSTIIFDSNGVFQDEWVGVGGPMYYKNNKIYIYTYPGVQVFDLSGNVLLSFGSVGAADGEMEGVTGITVDDSGNIYITEGTNSRVQAFDSSGSYLRKWGTWGAADGQFTGPSDIDIHPNGHVFVLDRNIHRIQEFLSDGTFVRKIGSQGSGDEQFNLPEGIHIDSAGYIYIADSSNHRIEKYNELFQIQSLAAELVAVSLAGDNLEVGANDGVFGSSTVRIQEPTSAVYIETETSVAPSSLPVGKIIPSSITPSSVIGGGTAQNWHADDGEWTYNLPFTFPYYGVDYTTIEVGSNGNICFTTAFDCTWYLASWGLENSTIPTIQLFGMDLVTDAAGRDIYITEEADRVIIRWDSEEIDQSDGNASGGTVEFELVLNDDGSFEMHYGAMPDAYQWEEWARIGISGDATSEYMLSEHNNTTNIGYNTLAGATSLYYTIGRDTTYADVSTDFQDDLDWSTIVASADLSAGKVVVDGLDIAAGVDSYTLYVPQLDGDDGVHLCPTETTLVGLTTACTDGYNLGQVEDSVGTTTIASVDYWVIPTAEVKGAFSTIYDPAFALQEPPAAPVTTPETPAEEDPVVTPVYYAASAEEDTTEEEEEVVEEEGDTDEETTVKDIINTVLEKSEEIKAETESSYLKRLWWFLIPALALGGWFEIERRKK